MTDDAGPGANSTRARRPGRHLLTAAGVLLVMGGGTAVAAGVLGQDADPPAPASVASPETSTDPTPEQSSAPPSTPSSSAPANPGALPAPTAVPETTAPAPAPAALPVSIDIPAIEVGSDLITVGLNPDGTLEVPQPGPDYDKAAWFDGSPRPGDRGPAVIEGHVDSAANGPSVFYDLGRLVPGDRVDVAREDGSVVTFEVDRVEVFPKDDFPTLEVYGNTEGPELRLITCGGPFDSSAGSYEDNTVVFAHQVQGG